MENPHGGDIYESSVRLDFSANVNPFGAPEAVLQAARDAMEEIERYPDPFCRELTAKIAENEGLPESYVFIGNGASELIYAYCMAQRLKKAVVAVPAFTEYAEALKRAGTDVVWYYLKKENSFVPDADYLEFLKAEQPDAAFLCSPNNPTGRTIPGELMKGILRFVKETQMSLFLDECFYELSDRQITQREHLAEIPGLFLLRAFTKCFGMAGLRLGYALCADAALLKEMATYTPPWSISTPAQKAGIAALSEKEFLENSKAAIRREREKLVRELTALGMTVYPSETNYLFFEAEEDLAQRLKAEGVLIRNCANYEGLKPGYYRIAVRTREENEELIRTLQRLERSQNG